jgi:hypothetical protein
LLLVIASAWSVRIAVAVFTLSLRRLSGSKVMFSMLNETREITASLIPTSFEQAGHLWCHASQLQK